MNNLVNMPDAGFAGTVKPNRQPPRFAIISRLHNRKPKAQVMASNKEPIDGPICERHSVQHEVLQRIIPTSSSNDERTADNASACLHWLMGIEISIFRIPRPFD